MITLLNRVTSMILSIIAWPLMVGLVVVSGIAWSANNWKFTDATTNEVNLNALLFILGIIVLIAYAILLIFRFLRKILKVILSLVLLFMLCLLAFAFGVQFQAKYNWTFDYFGDNQKGTYFWGFGFITIVSVLWLYLVNAIMWFSTLIYKRK